MKPLLLSSIVLLTLAAGPPTHAEQRLAQAELQHLAAYLDGLSAGNPSDPVMVDKLSGADFPCLLETMRVYAGLGGDVPLRTHAAFQTLLERLSRWTTHRRSLTLMYSDEGTRWTSLPAEVNPLSRPLFAQLLRGKQPRTSHDLCVRLTPLPSLAFISEALDGAEVESAESLLAAWNRRLRSGPEVRKMPGRDARLKAIAARFDPAEPANLRLEHLTFLGRWPMHRETYRNALAQCLAADDPGIVLTGLSAQRDCPALLTTNTTLLRRFPTNEAVGVAAIENFGFDSSEDHSARLREIWAMIDESQLKRRFYCLYAMGVHPAGNAKLALAAVKTGEPSLYDSGLEILRSGTTEQLAEGIAFVLAQGKRGLEVALRLAREHEIPGFEKQAVAIFRRTPDQIVKQAALYYLQLAPGAVRLELISTLSHPNDDLRLAAIQLYRDPRGLDAAQREKIGIALTRVYLNDPTQGLRQEALFTLAGWKAEECRPIFRQVIEPVPAWPEREGIDGEAYWAYRFRLVAMFGLANLGDKGAEAELLALYRNSGPQRRMDALLAFTELGKPPPGAFDDLLSEEMTLAATAANLIAQHGTPAEQRRMRELFEGSPYWKELRDSGLNDHGLFHYLGMDGP